jgi:hypothetical protein
MKSRMPLVLTLVAGSTAAAPAQEVFVVNYSWLEVIAGSITPVPAPNGVLEPGEGARIRVGVEARINGTSAVGQTTTFTNPAPGGVGTIRGLGSAIYDLIGDNGASTANGTWGGVPGAFQGPLAAAPFNVANTAGTVQLGGTSVNGFGGAQFFAPGQSANPLNSNVQVFRGVWTPASYANRSIHFMARGSVLVPTGEQNSVLLAYGIGTDPSSGENFDLIVGKYIPTVFGNGLTVPAFPSPSSLALLGVAALLVPGRRR